ncbi:MAG: hypothetical protein WBV82_06015 [Myxococcaceae bacterium]
MKTVSSEHELAQLLRELRERGGQGGEGFRISLAAFDQIGMVDVRSAVVEVGAGVRLDRLELELRARDLTLGAFSPGTMALDVATFLEGPWAGLRTIPGGRLETACLALTGVMADGLRYASRPSPRSAAGPDLDAMFLGAEGRFGRVTGAKLRVFPRPRSERLASWSFSALQPAVETLRVAVGQGCLLRRGHIIERAGRWLLAVEVIGGPESIERDLSTLGHCVFARGGRSSGQQAPFPVGAGGPEHELDWETLEAELGRGAAVTLWRISLESVIAEGEVAGGVPLVPGQRWPCEGPLSAIAQAADPAGILGGLR